MTTDIPKPWLASYAPGVPETIALPAGSLLDIVDASVAQYPKQAALDFFGKAITYAELGDQITRAAEGLRALGVKPGDPVAIILPNCPQHIVAFYAVLRLGAIVVEHNPLYTARELRHQFEDHAAKVVIAWDKVVTTLQDFPPDVAPATIVAVDITRAMPLVTRAMMRLPVRKARDARASLTTKVSGTVSWTHVSRSEPVSDGIPRPRADDVAVIQYTSGTTGHPKGATLTHLNLGVNAAQARAWVPTIVPGTAVVYAVLPMFHAYGLTLCLTFAMSMGARLVLFPKFDADLVLRAVRKYPPTFLPAVPPIYEKLMAAAKARGISLSGIQIAISGAMPLTASLVRPWEAETGGYLVEGYGLSETSPVLMANPVAPSRRAGTVGLPLPNTEIRVVDPENPSVDRDFNEAGELLARGPQVMGGYWNKPEETAAVFVADPNGGAPWFRTGDIVTLDQDGFVRVVDRIKEIIITGGFNVSPSEVEQALRSHPDVEDAAVVGLPTATDNEEVVAAVVLAPGAELDSEGIRNFLRGNLTPYKVPRRIVAVAELPKSLIGKTLRRVVRDGLLNDR